MLVIIVRFHFYEHIELFTNVGEFEERLAQMG
jgi:hypothetical protein